MTTHSNPLDSLPFLQTPSYLSLPKYFYQQVHPQPVPDPTLIHFNDTLAHDLQIPADFQHSKDALDLFSGQATPENGTPIALAYAGHQFGHFVPQLGDGRAVLLGECHDKHNKAWDVQLKGSGRTAFSRQGDGLCPLGPAIREYLVSEAMHALGVPTTRSLALVSTGDTVLRQQQEPGGIVTRVAASHLRIGTFEYAAAHLDLNALQQLCDYAIARHYPESAPSLNPSLSLLENVVLSQARLIAHWLSLGFVHGVMNTDNTAISGETIDYGPCAFMEDYQPAMVFSSIDTIERYAYNNQPPIAHWNLSRLASCLLPLIDPDIEKAKGLATEVLDRFMSTFQDHYCQFMGAKLGLEQATLEDQTLIEGFLDLLHHTQSDFTLSFYYLDSALDPQSDLCEWSAFVSDSPQRDRWLRTWRDRLGKEKRPSTYIKAFMKTINPAIIPRNHRIEEVIREVYASEDMTLFHRLLSAITSPFDIQDGTQDLMSPALPDQRVFKTFCGT